MQQAQVAEGPTPAPKSSYNYMDVHLLGILNNKYWNNLAGQEASVGVETELERLHQKCEIER